MAQIGGNYTKLEYSIYQSGQWVGLEAVAKGLDYAAGSADIERILDPVVVVGAYKDS